VVHIVNSDFKGVVRNVIQSTSGQSNHSIHTIHRMMWRHSNLWSQYDLCDVGQQSVLCKVKRWWRFVALFE